METLIRVCAEQIVKIAAEHELSRIDFLDAIERAKGTFDAIAIIPVRRKLSRSERESLTSST